ncbi:MAG: Dna2/Cas4 domain-containing protein [Alistipes sp.]|nr:Dna2/Cas4 domain-containing protein [Alistipes sp.]
MHKAFEEANDREGIEQCIRRMEQDAVLSHADAEELRRMVEKALSDPTVGSWFDGSWSEIRTEDAILSKGKKHLHRPDRVMIRGTEAVVVDYKFGELNAMRYRQQLDRYAQLLREMGYTKVSGYLWYVKQGTIEQVI